MLRRWLPLLAVAAVLAAVLAAVTLAEPQIDVAPLPESSQAQAPGGDQPTAVPTAQSQEPAPPKPATVFTIPGWVNAVFGVLCALAVLAVIGVLLWFVLRDTARARGRPVRVDPGAPVRPIAAPVAEVAAALDAGLAELSDTDSDPRRAVIACWVRLEEAAAAAGTRREVSDAPADYVLRLLNTHAVDRAVLDHFAAAYRHARYSTGPVDAAMRQDAIAALRQLRVELTTAVGTGR